MCLLQFQLNVVQEAVPAGRTRVRKVPMPCPCCRLDIADFLRTAQGNREMAAVILRLQQSMAEARAASRELQTLCIGIPESGVSQKLFGQRLNLGWGTRSVKRYLMKGWQRAMSTLTCLVQMPRA